LNHFYPELKIRGEEDSNDYSHLASGIGPSEVDRELIKWELLREKNKERKGFLESRPPEILEEVIGTPFETFNTNDAVVWIDPLDGTSDFVRGNLPAVTVLIGVSLKGIGKIGVVHHVFDEADLS
jgi:3'-phosphoadenosine 5'-phosphosulfate (PAPS) 3'-phosphatase